MPPLTRRARAACAVAGFLLIVLSTVAAASPIAPCRPTVVCTVEVERLPAVLLSSGGYELAVSGQPAIPLPSSGIVHVAIAEPVVVRLDGAAYQGSVSINPADCGGEAIHTIEAGPKPARLVFQAGDVPLSELVVSCVSGCSYKMRPADGFPELPFSDDEPELHVELSFKARGYRSRTVEFKLNPGDNPIRVTLDKID
jgi:hypothetical protein